MSYKNLEKLSAWLIASFENPDDWSVVPSFCVNRVVHKTSKIEGTIDDNGVFMFGDVVMDDKVSEAANEMLDYKFDCRQEKSAATILSKLMLF
mgnify:CR=1 FL=1